MKKLLFAFVPSLMTLLIVVFIMMQQVVKSTHVNPIPTLAVLPTETATLTPSPIPAKSIDVVFAPPSIQSTATSRERLSHQATPQICSIRLPVLK